MKPLEVALLYHSKGYSVIPVSPSSDEETAKKPLIAWRKYQKTRPSDEQIRLFWRDNPKAMVGTVTGQISGLIAFDADTPEAIVKIEEMIPESLEVPTVKTPGGGRHYHFKWQEGIRNSNNGLIHCRGEGGYIIMPPSCRDDGKKYEWLVEAPLPEIPEALKILNSYSYSRENGSLDVLQSVTDVTSYYIKGRRDEDLFHIANSLIKCQVKEDMVIQTLDILAKNCDPPFPESEAKIKIQSAIERSKRKERNLSAEARELIDVTNGAFHITNFAKLLQIVTKQDMIRLRTAISRMVKDQILERVGDKDGVYRKVENVVEEMNWENCDDTVVNVKWPFGLERFFVCLPKNIVVCAGSQNAGKTCFALNFAMLNMDSHKINYFSSEMGALELKTRLRKFPISISKWKKIRFVERSLNFADVIDPNAINIVDYIEVPEEAWKIALPINEIFRKLDKGIALIALQKPSSRDVARGGEGTLDRPRLYLSMGGNQLKITKCKNWSDEMDSQGINPNGLSCSYKIVQGCNFFQLEEWNRGGVNLMPPKKEERNWVNGEI